MKGYVVENGYMGYRTESMFYLQMRAIMKRCMRNSKRYGSCSAGTPPGNHETSLNFWSACGII